MNFVESLRMFHVDAKEIPCVTGKGAPTEKTLGAPGVLYMDTDTGDLYKCRAADAVNKVYTWEKIGGGSSDYKLPIGGAQLGGVKNGGNVVINEDGTMTAPEAGSIKITGTENSKIAPTGTILDNGTEIHLVSQEIRVNPGEQYLLTCSANFGNSLYAIYESNGAKKENLEAPATEEGRSAVDLPVTIPSDGAILRVAWNKDVTDTPYAVTKVGNAVVIPKSLDGVTVAVIGDSLVERNNSAKVNFVDLIAAETGATVTNLGVGGTGYMAGADESKAFYQRAAQIPEGTDRVLIYGSGNDRNMPLGNPTDTGTDTLCGCINATIDAVYERVPTAWVGIIAPAPWKEYPPYGEKKQLELMVQAQQRICARRGIPFLDLYHASGLRPWDDTFRELAFDEYGVHPNDIGHALIAPQIQAFLLGAIGGGAVASVPDSSQNVEIDTTLTQSGKAADAKAVGDKIAEITGISLVEPADDDMPKVFLTGSEFGNMTTAKNEVKMGLEYISKTEKFDAAIKIKFQGNTSLTFPKKNFTIKMYTDDTYEDKLKKNFKDWNHSSNKYVLKANWIDHAHARNIISARLWGEVVASRPDYDSLPVEMRNAPNNGAIDGFPVKLYINGNYEGVYTWNVGKDDWMWGMDEDNANHVLMCAETNNDGVIKNTPCNFRALWNGTDENNWTVEVGTNSDAVKTALNNLIQFVMDNDGDAFRNGIDNYLDIQSAIDYYIFQYEICGLDGLAKNMLLATYDGARWICGAYDMDATFGLYWNGSKFVSAQYRCPEDYQETYSLLWERIEANFLPELKARQAELRKTVLSYSNMVTHFERFMDVIGLDLYAEDLTIYTGIPSGSTNNIKQIRNYIRDRQAYVDAEFAAMTGGAVEPGDPDVPDEPDEPDTPVVPEDGLIYNLPEVTTLDGTNYIDTGVQLFAEDKPFTLMLEWEHTGESAIVSNTHVVAHCINEASPYPGLVVGYNNNGYSAEINQSAGNLYKRSRTDDGVADEALKTVRTVITRDASGNATIARRYNNTGSIFSDTKNIGYTKVTQNLLLGCYQDTNGIKGRYAKGIMHDCRVYDYAMTDAEIASYLKTVNADVAYEHSITSTGTQYIDTGIVPTPNTAVEIAYMNPDVTAWEAVFGTGPEGMSIGWKDATHYEFRFCGQYKEGVLGAICGQDTVVLFDGYNQKMVIDGTDVTPSDFNWSGNGRATKSMLLFQKYNKTGGLDVYSTYTLYYFKVWENGELIQHLVPHIDEEGVVCLYDEVSGECFYNQGAGVFIYT